MNETILAKAKTLLLLASANTLLLAVGYSPHTNYCNKLESNVKKYTRKSLTSCIHTFLLIVVTCFLIHKITIASIAADMMHYKQSIVPKRIFLNILTQLEYQYLLFIVIVFI